MRTAMPAPDARAWRLAVVALAAAAVLLILLRPLDLPGLRRVEDFGAYWSATRLNVTGGNGNMLINNSSISAFVGLSMSSTGGTVINRGSIIGNPSDAVTLSGANNLFVMEGPNASVSGGVRGSLTDTFRLAGSGTNTFNVHQIAAGFALFDKAGPSNWTVIGDLTYTGPVTVREGTLTVNGNLATSSGLSVSPACSPTSTRAVAISPCSSGPWACR